MGHDNSPARSLGEQQYVELRLSGIPQRDAAREAGLTQPRASNLDRIYAVPTSRNPHRVPSAAPDWTPILATCPACGRLFRKIDAAQRFCPGTRHRCAQNHRRRAARAGA